MTTDSHLTPCEFCAGVDVAAPLPVARIVANPVVHLPVSVGRLAIDGLRNQLRRNVQSIGLVDGADARMGCNDNSHLPDLIRAVVAAGLFPQVARLNRVRKGNGQSFVQWWGMQDRLTQLVPHPSSVCSHESKFRHNWAVYSEQLKTSQLFVRDVTVVSPYALLLFGGAIVYEHDKGLLRVGKDGWIFFRSPPEPGVLLKLLRQLLDSILATKLASPEMPVADMPGGREVISAVVDLICQK